MATSSCLIFYTHAHTSAFAPALSIICTHAKTSLKPLCKPNIAITFHCRSPMRLEEKKKPHTTNIALFLFRRRWWRVRSGDEDDYYGGGGKGEGEGEGDGEREYEDDDDDDNVVDDYEADYNDDMISPRDLNNGQSGSFVNTQGWKSEMVVRHRINQDEFHKIRLLHCDFFIRKAPDPGDDVFDFREMYVTPPEMDVYSIPEVVGKMPDKYVRLRKTDYGCYNVIELPVDRVRDDFAKTEFEVMKVFLMKHYKNKRADDPEFVLDFEEIYVIDSKTKSISRGNVVGNVPTGKNRDRRNETLIVRDQGTSFKIIPSEKRDSHDVVIEKLHWEKSRKEIETYLRSFRDFDTSNWF